MSKTKINTNNTFSLEIEKSEYDIELNRTIKNKLKEALNGSVNELAGAPKNNYYLAVTFWIISAVSYSFMVSFAKITYSINPDITPYDLMIMRGGVLLPTFLSYAYKYKVNLFDFKGNAVLGLTSSFFDAACIILALNAMKYISATKAVLIVNGYPLITAILAGILLKEVISNSDKIGIFLMILGCFMISYHNTHSSIDKDNTLLGYTLAIIAAILVAFCCIGLRKMNQSVHFLLFPFYFILSVLLICFGAYGVQENAINLDKWGRNDTITSFISSGGSLIGISFMSIAFKYADASQLAPLSSIQNVLNFLAEFYILHYEFGVTDVIGALILIGAFVIPVFSRYRTSSATPVKE